MSEERIAIAALLAIQVCHWAWMWLHGECLRRLTKLVADIDPHAKPAPECPPHPMLDDIDETA